MFSTRKDPTILVLTFVTVFKKGVYTLSQVNVAYYSKYVLVS